MNNVQTAPDAGSGSLYFAYGSNMALDQMARRCPGSAVMGRARLDGWTLRIDRRGVATIDPGGGYVLGTLWALTGEDEKALDRFEGVAAGYYRREVLQVEGPGGVVDTLVYIGSDQGVGPPRAGYLEILLRGARDTGLPEDYVEFIGSLADAEDTQ